MGLSLFDVIFDAADYYEQAQEFKNGNEQTRKQMMKRWGWLIGIVGAAMVVTFLIKVIFSSGSDPLVEEQTAAEAETQAAAEMQETATLSDRCARDPFLDECK